MDILWDAIAMQQAGGEPQRANHGPQRIEDEEFRVPEPQLPPRIPLSTYNQSIPQNGPRMHSTPGKVYDHPSPYHHSSHSFNTPTPRTHQSSHGFMPGHSSHTRTSSQPNQNVMYPSQSPYGSSYPTNHTPMHVQSHYQHSPTLHQPTSTPRDAYHARHESSPAQYSSFRPLSPAAAALHPDEDDNFFSQGYNKVRPIVMDSTQKRARSPSWDLPEIDKDFEQARSSKRHKSSANEEDDEVEIIEVNPADVDARRAGTSSQEKEKKGGLGKHWAEWQISELLEAILGPDADQKFGLFLVNPQGVYADLVSDNVAKPKSIKQMTSKYEALFKIYKAMRAFRRFTGGGGDADENPELSFDDSENIDDWLKRAKAGGRDVGELNAATVMKWETKGWYQLFKTRYNKSQKVERVKPRSSASKLSDTEDEKPAKPASTSKPQTIRDHVMSNMSGFNTYLESQTQMTTERLDFMNRRLEYDQKVDERRFSMRKVEKKISELREIIKDPDMDAEMRAWARDELKLAMKELTDA
ncbi:hypothetical protein BDZ89DRAFT_1164645 [Hymenopellis radicata]|nr:hypothetical protein BDZ89DRAFT_1164645 [Hymenopellis radicata]